MNWYYESEGKPQGPVSETLLRQLVREGKISLHTLVWSKGMPDWKPLSEAFEPPSATGQFPHSELSEAPLDYPKTPSEGGDPDQPAWEFGEMPWWQALQETVSSVILRPKVTFGSLSPQGGWNRPLSFFVLCSLIASVSFSLLFRIAPPQSLQSLIAQWLPQFVPPIPAQNPEIPLGLMIGLSAFFTVLMAPIEAFFASSILHFLLWITGGARRGWVTSFRVMCYAGGTGKALIPLQLVAALATSLLKNPSLTAAASLVSQLLVSSIGFWLLIVGMARAHQIALWRSILGLFVIPTLGVLLLIRLIVLGMSGA